MQNANAGLMPPSDSEEEDDSSDDDDEEEEQAPVRKAKPAVPDAPARKYDTFALSSLMDTLSLVTGTNHIAALHCSCAKLEASK